MLRPSLLPKPSWETSFRLSASRTSRRTSESFILKYISWAFLCPCLLFIHTNLIFLNRTWYAFVSITGILCRFSKCSAPCLGICYWGLSAQEAALRSELRKKNSFTPVPLIQTRTSHTLFACLSSTLPPCSDGPFNCPLCSRWKSSFWAPVSMRRRIKKAAPLCLIVLQSSVIQPTGVGLLFRLLLIQLNVHLFSCSFSFAWSSGRWSQEACILSTSHLARVLIRAQGSAVWNLLHFGHVILSNIE